MISIVIPCYNEENVLPLLHERLTAAAEAWEMPFEVVIVDDGSSDGSWDFHGSYPFSMSVSIVFESGTVDYNSSAAPTLRIYTPDGAVETPPVPEGSAYTEELLNLVGCIESGTAPDRVPNDSAALAVAVVAAEIRSTKSGRPAAVNV